VNELRGWLLDVYPGSPTGVSLWLIGEDGQRYHLKQHFPVTFYAAGPPARLRLLWRYLRNHPTAQLKREERRDVFTEKPLTVLAITAAAPVDQNRLFQQVAKAFPDLNYFDADIILPLRYAACYQLFPLARCQVLADNDGWVETIEALDSPWDPDPPVPPLRILQFEPDADPSRKEPSSLTLRSCQLGGATEAVYHLDLQPKRPLLINLRAILLRHDPDLLLTNWGDTWLLPHLLEQAAALGISLPLNRDPDFQPAHHAEISYFSYGQIVYRGQQVHLFGRCHIDRGNAMLWEDYDLEGAFETARVTGLPIQTAARVSPGSGISAMQMITALREKILVPWRKQQAERPKTALELISADQGGLVYQPLAGLHRDVGGIDFVSMYPGIMVRFNISPETVQGQRPAAKDLKPFDPTDPDEPEGLVPKTLAPLLGKRLVLKSKLALMPGWDPRRKALQARASAHKWLLVTCFGYLGYKNARFGRIEAHEAVTAYGREALLRAKDVAEDMGFTVLHLYVDGLWVKKPKAEKVIDFQPLLEEISRRTGLPIALDGIYDWVAFLPSRVNSSVPVANRYFGVFRDGSLKVRGIEARRGDTAPFIAETQMAMIELLAQSRHDITGKVGTAKAMKLLRRRLAELHSGKVAVDQLVVSQRLSRELGEYKALSPVARALQQLQAVGKELRPGQQVRFVYTRGKPGVYAWDLPNPPDPRSLDLQRYVTLLLRAAFAILEPFGMEESQINGLAQNQPAYQLRFKKQINRPADWHYGPGKSNNTDMYMIRVLREHRPVRDLDEEQLRQT
jgi:DNA polymerase II